MDKLVKQAGLFWAVGGEDGVLAGVGDQARHSFVVEVDFLQRGMA